MQLAVNTGERELVDFLYQLGTRNSLIRVRNMSLQPDGTRMRLRGQLALVASYQKKAPVRSVSSTAGASKPATNKPAAPAAKTNAPAPKTNAPTLKTTTPKPTTTAKPPPTAPTIASSSKTNVARQQK